MHFTRTRIYKYERETRYKLCNECPSHLLLESDLKMNERGYSTCLYDNGSSTYRVYYITITFTILLPRP